MKTDQQWFDELGTIQVSADNTRRMIRLVQADALEHAAKLREAGEDIRSAIPDIGGEWWSGKSAYTEYVEAESERFSKIWKAWGLKP